MKVFYFGCLGRKGHFFYRPGSHMQYWDAEKEQPFGGYVNTWLCPRPERLGSAQLHHHEGWTALSFWDRSVDPRPGSNSTFIVEGIHDFVAMERITRELFPEVWNRLTFRVECHTPGKPVTVYLKRHPK